MSGSGRRLLAAVLNRLHRTNPIRPLLAMEAQAHHAKRSPLDGPCGDVGVFTPARLRCHIVVFWRFFPGGRPVWRRGAVCRRPDCLTGFPGGLCATPCGPGNTCAQGASCTSTNAGDLCLATCSADADCRTQAGWACFPSTGQGMTCQHPGGCQPSCAGTCGDNGCNGTCGACPSSSSSTAATSASASSSRASSTGASSTAAASSRGVSSSLGGSGGVLSSSSGVGACLVDGAACQSAAQCCGARCSAITGTCGGCFGRTGPCGNASECCGTGAVCNDEGACGCWHLGESCSQAHADNCCFGTCGANNQCTCLSVGQQATSDAACCSQVRAGAVCSCGNGYCRTSADCCNGTCDTTILNQTTREAVGPGVGLCRPSYADEPCDSPLDCGSGVCTGNRCACASGFETCVNANDCCGGAPLWACSYGESSADYVCRGYEGAPCAQFRDCLNQAGLHCDGQRCVRD